MKSNEIELIQSIFDSGLKKAAESLSFFVQESVDLEIKDINLSSEINFDNRNCEEKFFVLTTEIMGKIEGYSYLVFTFEDVKKLVNIVFPGTELTDELSEDVNGLLLELDNIVSAGVVTEMANSLNCMTYGGPPSINSFNDVDELNAYFKSCMSEDSISLFVNSSLTSEKEEIRADMLWILGKTFLTHVSSRSLEIAG